MKLYFTPGACSLSPHIALREAGIGFDLEKVDLGKKQTASGADYKAINPKGAVPALQLDDGQVLTEGAVIVQYIADRKPEAKLAPAAGKPERYRLQEWLNYVATEIHKGIGPMFNPKLPAEAKAVLKEVLAAKFDFLAKKLDGKPYLMGNEFTVADGYLFTVLRWTKAHDIDLGKWPTLKAYVDRVAARPAVQSALKAEGLAN
ncbi:MAG TPA: glutathione transferase GstA [Alphaproteobacteria bacterium]|nr:glutathione transferase GstA [Alphaproteobacteria bacterium]